MLDFVFMQDVADCIYEYKWSLNGGAQITGMPPWPHMVALMEEKTDEKNNSFSMPT